jgi:hypothetical protein
MATESTEEHGNISSKIFIFSCSSVDSVAKIFILIRLHPKKESFCASGTIQQAFEGS